MCEVKQCQTNATKGGCADRDANPVADTRAGDSRCGCGQMLDVCDGRPPHAEGTRADGHGGTPRRMNCDRCPHMRRIRAALAPCQACEAGKLHGEVHVDGWAADKAHTMRVARSVDSSPSSCLTSLTPDQEDSWRKFMCALFDLPPEQLLLVRNIIKGRTYAEFRFDLAELNRKLRTRERMLNSEDSQGFRQLAHTWAKKIEQKLPQMREVMRVRGGDVE